MASDNFTHFRHSVFTRNDDKIREFSALLGRKGKEAYFYYFTLIELCSSESKDGQTEFRIHKETLRTLWETNTKGVHNLCDLLTSCALVMCNFCANHVALKIPNLPNYLGSYDTKKRKEKERKVNKSITAVSADFKPEFFESVIDEPKKNLPEISPKDFRNSKDSKIELAETRSKTTHQKLSDSGNYVAPEFLVIEYFNKVNNRNLKQVDSNYREIKARIKEGFTLDEMKEVVDHAAKVWMKSDFWRPLNRPSTLFNGKFNQWLEEAKQNSVMSESEQSRLISELFPGFSA